MAATAVRHRRGSVQRKMEVAAKTINRRWWCWQEAVAVVAWWQRCHATLSWQLQRKMKVAAKKNHPEVVVVVVAKEAAAVVATLLHNVLQQRKVEVAAKKIQQEAVAKVTAALVAWRQHCHATLSRQR